MASSMFGERRGVSSRRGGMTVLGKVAVPKPVNLPSQRSENQGNDPNVEIVPKGTLSWGSRSSSTNAWGSSALSPPNTGGGVGSPSFISRPSSGGSGTRPSTAGSERSHEPTSNAWGPSSRPSSASGVSTYNQTPTGARPRTAETRPGSSQLSRFAEPVSENSVSWGASGNSEKLLHPSSKVNAFSLSSGDFPTLGSEKSTESQLQEDNISQGRPVSASGFETAKGDSDILHTDGQSMDANRESGTLNCWKRDGTSSYGGGAPPAAMEKCMEPHPYPRPNVPQHFGAWHGPPVQPPPDGVWYKPSGGPPYRSPGPPGNYHVDPFVYCNPHLPSRPLPNSQAVPRPGSGPGRYNPSNVDPYRPHIPDSYARPVMPINSGAYPGHVPYESYYGPPHMVCSSNERDAPIMGMPSGPRFYGGYPRQNVHADSGNFSSRPGEYAPTNTAMVKEHLGGGHPQGSQQGPYKFLLKQHDDREGDDGQQKTVKKSSAMDNERSHERGSHTESPNARALERESRPGKPNARSLERQSEHGMPSSRALERGNRPRTPMKEDVSRAEQTILGSADFSETVPREVSSYSKTNMTKNIDNGLMKKPETSNVTREGSHVSIEKNPSLTGKGLNNKHRISEDRREGGHVSSREEKTRPHRVVDTKDESNTNEVNSGVVSSDNNSMNRLPVSSSDVNYSARNKRPEQITIGKAAISTSVTDSAAIVSNSSGDGEVSYTHIHKRAQGVQSGSGFRGKGRLNMQDVDGWRKKTHAPDMSNLTPVKNVEICSDVSLVVQEATEKSDPNLQGEAGAELHVNSSLDPVDYNIQRAKMREIATQRAKQLQKEEEERIREQKAKALAKLEELNRRAAAESSTEKTDHTLPPKEPIEQKQESGAGPSNNRTNADRSPNTVIVPQSASVTDKITKIPNVCESSDSLMFGTLKASIYLPQNPVITNVLPSSSALPPEVKTADVTNQTAMQQTHDTFSTKPKQMGYRKKQSITLDKNSSDPSVPPGNIGGAKIHDNVGGDVNVSTGESRLPSNNNITGEPVLQQKKKNSRGGRNKHKLDEVLANTPVPASVPVEEPVKDSSEMSQTKVSVAVSDNSGLVHPLTFKKSEGREGVISSAEQGSKLPTEEIHGRVNNHWKPQAHRRMPRNTQGNRTAEKIHSNEAAVWAPVRPLNKNEPGEVIAKIEVQTSDTSVNAEHNHQKSKRAEIERYVPKPVAEVMSRQGTTQQPLSPSANKIVSNDNNTGRAESSSLTTESTSLDSSKLGFAVSKNAGSKNSKHGKTQGLWRQRGATEAPVVHSTKGGESTESDQSKIGEKPIEQQQQSVKQDTVTKEQVTHTNYWDAISSPISTEPVNVPIRGNDHGVKGRGKRQIKGKVRAQSQNAPDGNTDKTVRELNQSDVKTASVESHGAGDQYSSSHWQPKSGANSINDRQGHKEQHRDERGGRNHATRNVKDNSNVATIVPRTDQANNVMTSTRREEGKKERKDVNVSNVTFHFQDQGPKSSAKELVHENVDSQNERSFSSAAPRHGHNNARFDRGQENSHGGRNSAVQYNTKPQRQPTDGDRRRNNSHYEYQPARSHTNEANNSSEGGGSSQAMGSRYRERGGEGQTHSRRGGSNYYRRNGAPIEVGASSGGNGN